MKRPAALVVTIDDVRRDPALGPEGRGARKLLVTKLYTETEREATEIFWLPPAGKAPCPVQLMQDTEVAVFTERARQERHYHREATEIYTVVEGSMTIEVDDVDYTLHDGDMIVVNPGAVHEVKPGTERFICRVVAVNSRGSADKFSDG